MQECIQFKLNSAVLFNRIEEIKRNPPQKFLAYKAEHPEFKTVNCALLADCAGLSESTLKNLKLGKITDCNCSTAYLVCSALDIDVRDLLNMPKISDYDPDACQHNRPGADDSAAHLASIAAQMQNTSEVIAKQTRIAITAAAALTAALAVVLILVH